MSQLRFVLLEHEWNGVHYDLMFEAGETLRTWRLDQPPAATAAPARAAGEHRRLYLDFQGPLSGGRGAVRRWDFGLYRGNPRGPAPIRLKLHGEILRGEIELSHVQGDEWTVRFTPE